MGQSLGTISLFDHTGKETIYRSPMNLPNNSETGITKAEVSQSWKSASATTPYLSPSTDK